MGSSQRPRPSLPPEFDLLDEGWGSDEQPTVARPSRLPTSPARPDSEEAPAPDFSLELDLESERRSSTAPMGEDQAQALEFGLRDTGVRSDFEVEAPIPPDSVRRSDSLELDLSQEQLTLEPADKSPSAFPTAPPPDTFEAERMATMRRESAGARATETFVTKPMTHLHVDRSLEPTDPPPPVSGVDNYEFSGRFSSAPPDTASNAQAMKDRFAMGDFSGALALAEGILKLHPNDSEAQSLARKCREVLYDMYASRIADMCRVPQVAMTQDQIRWLSLDHRAGFMLSMIDGSSSVDDLLDVSGMQRLDAMRILCSLLDQKVITLR